MSQQTDLAKFVQVESVDDSFLGQKLRIPGRLLSFDSTTSLILLVEGLHGLLVDVSLCVDHWSGDWVRERLGMIWVIGRLEVTPVELPIPMLPTYAAAPALDPKLVVRAVMVMPTSDLDISLWHTEIEKRKETKGRLAGHVSM